MRSFFQLFTGCMILMLAACTRGNDPQYNDRPVVTGYLMADHYPSIMIKRQSGTSNGVAVSGDNLDSLQVFLSDDSLSWQLIHEDSFYLNRNLILQEGKAYHLSFFYNGKEVTASTTIPSKPKDYSQSVTSIELEQMLTLGPPSSTMPDPVDLTWTNDDQTYYMLLATDTTSGAEMVRAYNADRPSFAFRNQPAITGSTQLNAQSFEYFGTYRLVLYHLHPEYATLYENSSSSSQDLTTPVTNVTNGFGIFTGIHADTLYLEVKKK